VRCGRDASYLLRASGEALCRRCLERTVVRAIRRAVGRYGVLTLRAPLAVVEPLKDPLWFLSSLIYLSKSLRSHGNKVALLSYRGHSYRTHLRGFENIYVLDINVNRDHVVDMCKGLEDPLRVLGCILKAEYIVGIASSRSYGIRAIALMRPRDLCSFIGFLGIAYTDLELAVEALPIRIASEVAIINPIYNIPSMDLSALAFLSSEHVSIIYEAPPNDQVTVAGAEELIQVYSHSPEIMYSSSEAVRKILSNAAKKCSICMAPISSGEVCSMCSYLYPLLKYISNTSS
jgi:hypothetical protein